MVRDAGLRAGHARRARNARRYLYELLSGCSLRTAPPPYQITTASAQAGYNTFTITMTTDLASALDDHARRILATWGITSEPLQWQPPPTWVTATTWPGADPAQTDPAPIHRALLRDHAPPARIAACLGISIDHLRQVLRHHPLPRPLHPARRTPAPAIPPADAPPGQPGLDPAWLREEYHTWRRPLEDIASQTGYPAHALSRLARANGIPIRPRGSGGFNAPGYHPRDLPEPLRRALTGCHPQQRLQRLLAIAEHASISRAARTLGISQAAIHTQLARLEHTCGSPLIHRQRGSRAPTILTPPGELLCQQARDYLGLTAASPAT